MELTTRQIAKREAALRPPIPTQPAVKTVNFDEMLKLVVADDDRHRRRIKFRKALRWDIERVKIVTLQPADDATIDACLDENEGQYESSRFTATEVENLKLLFEEKYKAMVSEKRVEAGAAGRQSREENKNARAEAKAIKAAAKAEAKRLRKVPRLDNFMAKKHKKRVVIIKPKFGEF